MRTTVPNKIEESVYSLLKVQIERFGLKDRFRILNNKIENIYTGSEYLFYGLWRNIDEIKSLEGVDICWLEEAHNITKEQWEILEPTIRKEHSQFWIVFNPKLTTDFVYRRFVTNPPPNTVVRKLTTQIILSFLKQLLLLLQRQKKRMRITITMFIWDMPRKMMIQSLLSEVGSLRPLMLILF
ncbi:phage terminase large subunit [Acinetobacter vivianii]